MLDIERSLLMLFWDISAAVAAFVHPMASHSAPVMAQGAEMEMRTTFEINDHVRPSDGESYLATITGDWTYIRELENNIAVVATDFGDYTVPISQLTLVCPARGPYSQAPLAQQFLEPPRRAPGDQAEHFRIASPDRAASPPPDGGHGRPSHRVAARGPAEENTPSAVGHPPSGATPRAPPGTWQPPLVAEPSEEDWLYWIGAGGHCDRGVAVVVARARATTAASEKATQA